MTKRDYERVAAAIMAARAVYPPPATLEQYVIDKVTYAMAQSFALTNPRFRMDVFLDACGTVGLLRLETDAQGSD